jgi:hypothetical protein
MEEKKEYSFELHEDMLNIIENDFSPEDIASKLDAAIKGKPETEKAGIGEEIFTEYGSRWGQRVVDLGESFMDRTYEIMKEVMDETGNPAFPLIPQRFIEIAYLSTQKISTLPIVENNIYRLIFRINNCRTYQAVLDKCGQGVAKGFACQYGCINLCQSIMDGLGIDNIETEITAATPQDGHCEFTLRNTKA